MRAFLVIALWASVSHARRVQGAIEQPTNSREKSFASMLLAMQAAQSNLKLARARSVGMQIGSEMDMQPLPAHEDYYQTDFVPSARDADEPTAPGDLPPVPEYEDPDSVMPEEYEHLTEATASLPPFDGPRHVVLWPRPSISLCLGTKTIMRLISYQVPARRVSLRLLVTCLLFLFTSMRMVFCESEKVRLKHHCLSFCNNLMGTHARVMERFLFVPCVLLLSLHILKYLGDTSSHSGNAFSHHLK